MKKVNGGPAFPIEAPHSFSAGMTLRDYFAAKAMAALIVESGWQFDSVPKNTKQIQPKHIAAEAYLIADAMIAKRVK